MTDYDNLTREECIKFAISSARDGQIFAGCWMHKASLFSPVTDEERAEINQAYLDYLEEHPDRKPMVKSRKRKDEDDEEKLKPAPYKKRRRKRRKRKR